jgi:hypothetical protein
VSDGMGILERIEAKLDKTLARLDARETEAPESAGSRKAWYTMREYAGVLGVPYQTVKDRPWTWPVKKRGPTQHHVFYYVDVDEKLKTLDWDEVYKSYLTKEDGEEKKRRPA